MFARYSSIHRVVITCAAVLTGALQFLVAQTNTAVGIGALSSNTTGAYNTAFGVTALNRNTTGFHNTANGAQALYYNTTGNYNTAFGVNALHNNISGGFNTSSGTYSLLNNTTGNNNVSTGYAALYLNTTGSNNAVYGYIAGAFQADGSTPLIPNNSIYIGASSRGYSNSDSNSIVIGYQAIGEGANTTVIGNSSTTTAHIYGTLVVSGLTVGGQSVLTQAAAAATYLTSANAASTYLPKASFDPNGDGKIDTAQMTGVAPLAITNSTASTSSTTGALVISGGLGVAKDAYINGMRVGLGAGSNGSNTVLGNGALNVNTTGDGIVAVGSSSLASNTTGAWNTAVGFQSLAANTTGYWNMAVGFQSLFSNTTGAANSAAGFGALSSNTTGFHNTADGYYALRLNTTGAYNTANGSRALYSNTTGTGNIAFGVDAGNFQADGVTALTTVNNSVYLGTGSRGFDNADNNAIVIGYQAIGEGANTTVIGNAQTTSAHIYGQLNVSSLNVAGQPVLTQAAVAAGYQPIDTDLASIAALTTTTYGQSLLTGADAAATRSNLGLGTLATQNGTITDYLTTATAATTYQPLDADLSSIANLSTTAFGRGILTAADAAAARSMLGVGAGGGGGGTGDVVGPVSSADGSIALFNGDTGKILKSSASSDGYINGVRVGAGAGSTYANTALGSGTLNANTTGFGNTALGSAALSSNTTGIYNTVNGFNALNSNTTGGYNTAVGTLALQLSTTGNYNTAIGAAALHCNTSVNSTATGAYALFSNTTGSENTATGTNALGANTTGYGNVAIGSRAGLFEADDATGLIPNMSIYIGAYSKGLNADNNAIVIGYGATSEGANTTVIGNSSTTSAHIYGQLNVSSLNVAGQPVLTQATAASTYLTTAQASTGYIQNGSSGILLGTLVNGATGNISIALGQYSYANDRSVSIGFEAGSNGNGFPVSGQESVAIGRVARAPGMFATAVGRSTWVEGAESIGLGHGSTTRELGGVALGRFAESVQVGQVVLGSFNVVSQRSSTPTPTDDLLILGNGTAEAERSNAFVIKRNGDTEVKGDLKVEKNTTVTGSTTLNGATTVNGSATVTGQLIITTPAGGIDMGEFGNP